eukprot:symbB.v1.2.006697.t1/scaffold404.1/size210989/3
MELAARQVQFQALEKAAVDVLLTSRVSRAVLLALLLVFIDRICHFLWKAAAFEVKADQMDLEVAEVAPGDDWPRLIGRGVTASGTTPCSIWRPKG